MGRLVSALVIAAALAGPAGAHEKLGARKVVATARLDGEALALDVMVWMRLAGPRAEGLRARYDVDRSGQLERAEAALAGDALAPEAIGGLVVRRAGVAQPPTGAEARARVTPDGAIEVAVLLGWALGPLGDGAAIELASREGRDRPQAPVMLAELAALPPLALSGERPIKGGVVMGPLVPGRTAVGARVARVAAGEGAK